MMRAEISTRPLAGGLYTITITEDDSDLEQGENLNTFIAQVEVKGRSYFFPLVSTECCYDDDKHVHVHIYFVTGEFTM